MKNTITVCFFILLTISAISQSDRDNRSMDVLKTLHQDHKVVGLSGAYSIDGEIQWMDSYGYADEKEGVAYKNKYTKSYSFDS